jgi:hypothetical protein
MASAFSRITAAVNSRDLLQTQDGGLQSGLHFLRSLAVEELYNGVEDGFANVFEHLAVRRVVEFLKRRRIHREGMRIREAAPTQQ